jgi:thiol-disulfide isomerase/thioredoxin
MNRRLVLILIVAALAVLFYARSRSNKNGGQPGTPGTSLSFGNEVGASAPEFELPVIDSNGKTLKLSDLKGKAVLLNFWATYCVPCKTEMPWLVKMQQQYGPQGLQIVGVTKDGDSEKTALEFTKKMGINYPVLAGSEKVEDSYGGINGLPTTFFIDRSGKVVVRRLGQMKEDQIVEDIKKSLGQS